ncbi:MAG: TIGR04002 family protein [Oscillospiraceae bacterium]|jgi:uncharacterized repeat protein (TIGR04002 family)|nr:TIGR04002 family protein [Oscillospiraceae bacterium]
MKRNRLQLLTLTALIAALTAALTSLQIIPAPNGGYAHVGDSIVFLAGCLLPAPYSLLAAAIGGGLADLLRGAPNWLPATVILKACMALCFGAKSKKLLSGRNIAALAAATIINMAGYYFYEWLFLGKRMAQVAFFTGGGLIQSGGSIVLFVGLAIALDAIRIKDRMQLKRYH